VGGCGTSAKILASYGRSFFSPLESEIPRSPVQNPRTQAPPRSLPLPHRRRSAAACVVRLIPLADGRHCCALAPLRLPGLAFPARIVSPAAGTSPPLRPRRAGHTSRLPSTSSPPARGPSPSPPFPGTARRAGAQVRRLSLPFPSCMLLRGRGPRQPPTSTVGAHDAVP
jgi:hypothetical protein